MTDSNRGSNQVDGGSTESKPMLSLMRHGETTANMARLLQGVTDSPLTVHGQAQVDAVARAFAEGGRQGVSGLAMPTLIVSSPIGRARKTAEAIHRACGGSKDDPVEHITHSGQRRAPTATAAQPLRLIIDVGLQERDFGRLESTRSGKPAAGFASGSGAGESKLAFRQRVHRVGLDWLRAAASSSRTHILLVTHGLWLSSFFSAHPPRPPDGAPAPQAMIPFASNTGIYSLVVQPYGTTAADQQPELDRICSRLVRANDTHHLASVKRQRGGIGSAASDERQTKLASFFGPPSKRSRTG